MVNATAAPVTPARVVLPFYIYAALSFLAGTLLLVVSTDAITLHFFNPKLLAITHIMALGWGTMMILGVSHQMIPILIDGKVYSIKLAQLSFLLAAIGIPLLIHGFYYYELGAPALWGGRLIILAVLAYLVNLGISISRNKNENVHAVYIFTAVSWLFITAFAGLLLLYNFTYHLLPNDSIHYLSLHAHTGILGWFLLLITGVGSKLLPMFLYSAYNNNKLLWFIYFFINTALISFIIFFFNDAPTVSYFIPILLAGAGLFCFAYFIFQCFKNRTRKEIDAQMKTALFSVAISSIPLIISIVILMSRDSQINSGVIIAYGFLTFFGWITAIILGMTFKTLPLAVWNYKYNNSEITPSTLFSYKLFVAMVFAYIPGLLLFSLGVIFQKQPLLLPGAILILGAAILYNMNVIKTIFLKK